jgi:hypothetical protein
LQEQSALPIENLRGSLAADRHFERVCAPQKKIIRRVDFPQNHSTY